MKNKEGGIIYGAMCTANQKWYIGQTVNYKQRKHNHLTRARHNYDRCVFHAAIRKYGEDCFEWTVLESGIKTHDELNEREKYWIQEKNSLFPNGYNMNGGGNGTANHRKNFVAWNKGKTGCYTEETLRRMSEARRGIHHSDESRRRMSENRRGIPLSEETRKRISIANKGKNKGKTHSEETRKRISIANKGKKLSEETRKRLSIANKGKKLSEETRKRISIANKGKKRSEETRKRLSIAKKGKTHSEETRKRLSIVNKGKGAKPVLMFNRNGDFVAEFPSITAAAEYLSVSTSQVAAVLNGTHKFTGGGRGNKNAGYMFRYKNENPDR